jgi:hypothetical protein
MLLRLHHLQARCTAKLLEQVTAASFKQLPAQKHNRDMHVCRKAGETEQKARLSSTTQNHLT